VIKKCCKADTSSPRSPTVRFCAKSAIGAEDETLCPFALLPTTEMPTSKKIKNVVLSFVTIPLCHKFQSQFHLEMGRNHFPPVCAARGSSTSHCRMSCLLRIVRRQTPTTSRYQLFLLLAQRDDREKISWIPASAGMTEKIGNTSHPPEFIPSVARDEGDRYYFLFKSVRL